MSQICFPPLAKRSELFQLSDSTSPSSTQESSPKDWMSNLQALEDINKAGLMNVLKVSSQMQTIRDERTCFAMQPFAHKQMKLNKIAHEKIEEKVEDGLAEAPLYKKVRLESNLNAIKPQTSNLSNMVDEQFQKLPKDISDKVQNMLNKAKPNHTQKISKASSSSSTPQEDKPLKVLAFKFDEKQKAFKYLVEWKPRADGFKPKTLFLTKEEMMRIDPGLIVSYYEEQVARTFHNVMLDNDDLRK